MQERLDGIQKDILNELKDFDFSNLSKRANVSSLNDLTYANGGKPIINYIVTTYRSGSNFLTDVLYSFPGTYVHHEPLIAYDEVRLRDTLSQKQAYDEVRDFLKCDFSDKAGFFETVKGKKLEVVSPPISLKI